MQQGQNRGVTGGLLALWKDKHIFSRKDEDFGRMTEKYVTEEER